MKKIYKSLEIKLNISTCISRKLFLKSFLICKKKKLPCLIIAKRQVSMLSEKVHDGCGEVKKHIEGVMVNQKIVSVLFRVINYTIL